MIRFRFVQQLFLAFPYMLIFSQADPLFFMLILRSLHKELTINKP